MNNTLPIQPEPFHSRPQKFWYSFCAVCLSLYLSAALYLCRSGLFLSLLQTAAAAVLFLLIAAAAFLALRFLSVRPLPRRALGVRKRLSFKVFALSAGISLALLGVFVAADYPGGVSVDSAVQWTQAATHTYSNWHPVFHTLLLRLGYLLRPNYGLSSRCNADFSAWRRGIWSRCCTHGGYGCGRFCLCRRPSPCRRSSATR